MRPRALLVALGALVTAGWGQRRAREQKRRHDALDARVAALVGERERRGEAPPSQRQIAMRCGVSRSQVERSLARLMAPAARLGAALAELERTGAAHVLGDERGNVLALGCAALADHADLAGVASVAPGILDSLFDLAERNDREGAIVHLAAACLTTPVELARSVRTACGTAAVDVAEGALELLRREAAGPGATRRVAPEAAPAVAGRASGAPGKADARTAPPRGKGGRAPSSSLSSSRRARS